MHKIKVFALGGLNENGKEMYVIEVDEAIFVFDAGLKFSDSNLLGIDYIIPNFEYLVKNKNRVKGLFLSHGHIDNIGSVSHLLKEIPELKMFSSDFTASILREELEEAEIKNYNLYEVKPNQKLLFDNVKIVPIKSTHSIPGSFGFAVETQDGIIYYTSDFLFDSKVPKGYETDLTALSKLSEKGVICLLCESIYAERAGYTSPNHRLDNFLSELFMKYDDKRIVFTVFEGELHRIQELFDGILDTPRKVVLMGNKLQKLVKSAIEMGYLTISEDKIGNLSDINDKNSVILISNEKESPFLHLEKIFAGYDKYIKLKADDVIVIAQSLEDGSEKKQAQIMDEIARIGAIGIKLSSKKNALYHASKEDIMLMIKLLNPKYYFPINGEYRYLFQNMELALLLGISKENVILKQNGEVALFEDGKLTLTNNLIPADAILIDGNSTSDVGDLVLKDREILSSDGIVIISVAVDRETKSIVSGPEVNTKGFIYVKNNFDLLEEVKKQSLEVVKKFISGQEIDHNKIKLEIRDKISKYLYKETMSNPMIISVVTEV